MYEGKHYAIIDVGVKMQHQNERNFPKQLRRPETLCGIEAVEGETEEEKIPLSDEEEWINQQILQD